MTIDISKLKPATQLVHAGRHDDPDWIYVNPPVIRASTVLHDSVADMLSRIESAEAMRPDRPTYGTHGSKAPRRRAPGRSPRDLAPVRRP